MIALAAAAVARALGGSLRVRVSGREHFDGLVAARRPFLFAVWHCRMLIPIHRHRDQGVIGLVSLSKDGDFAAGTLHRLGYTSVRGSSSRGGSEAFHELVERMVPGAAAAIIPDGPRGPAQTLKPGILRLASRTGAAILPLSSSARPAKRLKSWDRFLVPLPFARAAILYGAPVDVPAGLAPADEEAMRLALEETLDRLDAEADASLDTAGSTAT